MADRKKAAGEALFLMTVSYTHLDVYKRQSEDIAVTGDGASFPPSATLCHKCNTKALVIMDGCATCLNCGYSKCG